MSLRSRLSRHRLVALFIVIMFPFAHATAGDLSERPVRIDVGGFKLNSLLIDAGENSDLPPIVFIHGASTSLYDPLLSFRDKLAGRATLLFVDRPGHGASDTGGDENVLPDGQADAIATLMDKRGIAKAVIVGHSFGGAIAAAFAVRHPDKVVGLVFLSPAVYPWSTGVAWYYDAARVPISGQLFSALIVPPIGLLSIDQATKGVFAPNRRPSGYVRKTRALQAISPARFRHNAREIAALSDWAKSASPGYKGIRSPTVIITGDIDEVVSPDIHARHLARDIRGSRLIVVRNLGHKSDYVASDLAIAAIEKVSGKAVNLQAVARSVERRIADDGKD